MSNVTGFTNPHKINKEAAEWVLLIEDTPQLSKEQIKALNEWVSTSDVHRKCLESMANSWGEMGLLAHVMAPKELQMPSRSSRFLNQCFRMLVTLKSGLGGVFKPVVWGPVLFVMMGWLAFLNFPEEQNLLPDTVLVTQMGEHSQHTLDDGSSVWLNSNSQIEVVFSDNTRRINLIKGEAHFDVVKDASRPFEVYSDNRLVRAIGTAFSVYRLSDRIEVLVTEGRVELAIVDETLVITPDDHAPIEVATTGEKAKNIDKSSAGQTAALKLGELIAGQRVSIPTGANPEPIEIVEQVVELDSSEITRKLSWRKGKLIFAGEPLEDVVAEITRHTAIKIELTDPSLKTMRIGGQFQAGETDALFYVLETGFGIDVNEVSKDHVQLQLKRKTQ